MERTFTFSSEEFYILRYAVSHSICDLECLMEKTKFIQPDNTTAIKHMKDMLFDLECVHSKMFEGGDDECCR